MARVALVTAPDEFLYGGDEDLPPAQEALADLGIRSDACVWSDSSINWSDYDIAVMRCPWDYPLYADKFLRWLDSASAHVRILNPPSLIRWNLDKTYLLELAQLGVDIVDTSVCSDLREVTEAIESYRNQGLEQVVVKPNVSAGSRDTGRFRVEDERATSLARTIFDQNKLVLVQPAVASVATDGELALMHFNGRFSHAIRKGPILDLDGQLLGGVYQENITADSATEAQKALARDTIDAVAQIVSGWTLGSPADAVPLYGRIDIVDTPAGPKLLEAELFEPSLFFGYSAGSAAQYAQAVQARLT